jgi:hypothetical protein
MSAGLDNFFQKRPILDRNFFRLSVPLIPNGEDSRPRGQNWIFSLSKME